MADIPGIDTEFFLGRGKSLCLCVARKYISQVSPPPLILIVNREMLLLTNSCEWQLLKAHVHVLCYKTGKLGISFLFVKFNFLWGGGLSFGVGNPRIS